MKSTASIPAIATIFPVLVFFSIEVMAQQVRTYGRVISHQCEDLPGDLGISDCEETENSDFSQRPTGPQGDSCFGEDENGTPYLIPHLLDPEVCCENGGSFFHSIQGEYFHCSEESNSQPERKWVLPLGERPINDLFSISQPTVKLDTFGNASGQTVTVWSYISSTNLHSNPSQGECWAPQPDGSGYFLSSTELTFEDCCKEGGSYFITPDGNEEHCSEDAESGQMGKLSESTSVMFQGDTPKFVP